MSDKTTEETLSPMSAYAQVQCIGRFQVRHLARYLSHAELLRTFQRACVRAHLALHYSQGFNPRPKISLPLPKSVGTESAGDLVCFYVDDPQFSDPKSFCEQIWQKLSKQLPSGITLDSVSLSPASTKWYATEATYVIPVGTDYRQRPLCDAILKITADDTLTVERITKRGTPKSIHVKDAIRAVQWAPEGLLVTYKVDPGGAIRLNEIMNLLGLEADHLDGPVQRTAIQWQQTQRNGPALTLSDDEE